MPDPRSLFRLVALAGFLLLVALGLWLLDADWPVIVAVMAAAWALAAVVEWTAWRQERFRRTAARLEPNIREEPAAEHEVPAAPAVLLPPQPEWEPEPEEEAAPPPPKPWSATEPTPPPVVAEPATAEPRPEPPPARPPLRPLPQPPSQPSPQRAVPPAAARAASRPPGVVDLRRRATTQARTWNIWDLERLAREELHGDPERFQELSYLFVHLRQFASPDGSLPAEFDPLVRDSLGDLLDRP